MRSGARKPGDVGAVEVDAAVGGAQLSGDQIEIGGLAGAVGADDGRQLARPKRAADTVDRDVAAEANGEIAGFEQGHAGIVMTRSSLSITVAPL